MSETTREDDRHKVAPCEREQVSPGGRDGVRSDTVESNGGCVRVCMREKRRRNVAKDGATDRTGGLGSCCGVCRLLLAAD